jgi:Glycosyl hydrolases family 28
MFTFHHCSPYLLLVCARSSCRHVLIEYVDVSCGDDHIAIKSGICGGSSPNDCTDPIWASGAYQTDNVTIRHSTFRRGMGIAIGSEMSGSVTNVHIYNNSVGLCDQGDDHERGCGWGPAMHVKTTITRGGRLENITFFNNTVWNSSMFIFLEMGYQSDKDAEPPAGYEPTVVRNISFVSNQALGSATAAVFSCSKYDACHGVTVFDNRIVNAVDSPWHCRFIADDYFVAKNIPQGLDDCMEGSMSNITALQLAALGGQLNDRRLRSYR